MRVIRAKAWASASAEPAARVFEVSDPTFGKGRVGLRACWYGVH